VYHIEFLGPPGAGKTTLRQELVAALPDALGGTEGMYECCRRAGRFTPLFGYWPKYVREAFWGTFLRLRFRRQYENEYPETLTVRQELIDIVEIDNMGLINNRLTSIYKLYDSTTSLHEPVVLDDGLYQFHLPLVEHDCRESLAEYLPMPDVLVCARAPAPVCLERQESRDRGRASMYTGLEQETVIDRLDEANEATEQVATDIEQHGGDVIRIDTNKPLPDLRDELLAAVRAGFPNSTE